MLRGGQLLGNRPSNFPTGRAGVFEIGFLAQFAGRQFSQIRRFWARPPDLNFSCKYAAVDFEGELPNLTLFYRGLPTRWGVWKSN
jgi:hypothetical protein